VTASTMACRVNDFNSAAVFQQPGHYPEDQWRIRSSGTHGIPELSKQTAAVVVALDELGIEMQRYWSATPINPDSFRIIANFLDGGLEAMRATTGTIHVVRGWEDQRPYC